MEEDQLVNFVDDILQNRNLEGNSPKWANWMSLLTPTTCKFCMEHHGKIMDISILRGKSKVEAHTWCKCKYVAMRTKLVGTATDLNIEGTDIYIMYFGRLPDYYVSFDFAKDAGWRAKRGNLNEVLPGKMIGGDLYKNRDGKLPQVPGRMWYEADINYEGGHRNRQRILYSNDGLVFVSYDHYQTFYEIID